GRHHLFHGPPQGRLALHARGPLLAAAAARAEQRRDRERGRDPPPLHACHSIRFATAVPTTRPMSCPVTTMPWRSSSRRSKPSSSSRRSARVGRGRTGAVGGGMVSVPVPPPTASARPL